MLTLSPLLIFFTFGFTTDPAWSQEYDLWKTGRSHWYKNEWEKGAEAFRSLIEQYPNSPRRCKSENYLGYCLVKMGKKRDAFDIYNQMIDRDNCKTETLDDAKSSRLKIAYELYPEDPGMKQVLLDGLSDSNIDIRLSSAVWLSELNDPSGIEVFFYVVKHEQDQDRKDTAARHILKLGSKADKDRLNKILDELKVENSKKQPKMIRLIIRDLKSDKEELKFNLPIGLLDLAIKTLNEEQMNLIRDEAGIDLRKLDIDLTQMPSGMVLFQVIDSENKEIKLFLE